MECGACGGKLVGEFTVREMMQGTRQEFNYRQCGKCESLWLSDAPEDLTPFYADDYYSLSQQKARPDHWDYYRWLKNRSYYAVRRFKLAWPQRLSRPAFSTYGDVAGLHPQARVLDVGCGSGHLLAEMRRCGFSRLVGVDPFIPSDLDHGKLRLIKGDLDQVSGEFDVVMMHHSLEHVPSPAATLSRARSLLSADGRIVVAIPLVAEAWRLYGVDWVQLDAPRHTVLFSVDGFEQIAQRSGLEIVHQYRDSSAFQFWGSEQYKLGIPLNDPRSPAEGAGQSLFSQDQMDRWSAAAHQMNKELRGDQGVFVLAPLDA